ncbi:tyrosine-type recombinase/integrase [Halospeciosus flavus]|uniref:Tyrosine-type recombinase/integrase n=1 Tax=Halospeciosus flavus TaxID=3032283 RepID=A0ABD5Z2F8_9EURY|nr:tyrosine-type recombinase/integrase [Halospeciosus flavus]
MSSKVDRAIEAHHSYKERGSKNTAREYRRHIRQFRDYLRGDVDGVESGCDADPFDCHAGHVEDFYQWMLDEGYAPSSVRVAHAALGDFYEQVETYGDDGRRGFPTVVVDVDPTENATPERLDGMHSSSKKDVEGGDKPLTRDEVSELVDNVPAPTIRNELIVRLLYQTGMRRSELVRVKLDHIDRENRRITVYGKKTDESRTVWYQSSLDWHLTQWIESERDAVFNAAESDYLFPTRRDEMMSEQTVTDVVTEAAENADLQETIYQNRAGQSVRRVGAHTLRKSFGVHFINSGGDISFLMELLGHENIETTKENYLKYSEKDLRESVARHGPSV